MNFLLEFSLCSLFFIGWSNSYSYWNKVWFFRRITISWRIDFLKYMHFHVRYRFRNVNISLRIYICLYKHMFPDKSPEVRIRNIWNDAYSFDHFLYSDRGDVEITSMIFITSYYINASQTFRGFWKIHAYSFWFSFGFKL